MFRSKTEEDAEELVALANEIGRLHKSAGAIGLNIWLDILPELLRREGVNANVSKESTVMRLATGVNEPSW